MAQITFSSRRAALLASVAGVVLAGSSWDAIAQGTTYNLPSAFPLQSSNVYNLQLGDELLVGASGSSGINSSATGYQPFVGTGTVGVG